jgi:cell wall-associated NlpC family hydrolase
VSLALSLRGTPYRNGGSDLAGFDCSGFVQWVFAQQGVALPREVKQQYRVGRDIDTGDVKAGDLVFFETVLAWRVARGDRAWRRRVRPRAKLTWRGAGRALFDRILG